MAMFAKLLRLKQCLWITVHFCITPDHYCSRLAWCPLIRVGLRRRTKPNLNGKLVTNIY